MSDRIEIRESESGVVRVFDVNLDRAEAETFNRRNGSWPLRDALGAETLDPHHVDLIGGGPDRLWPAPVPEEGWAFPGTIWKTST